MYIKEKKAMIQKVIDNNQEFLNSSEYKEFMKKSDYLRATVSMKKSIEFRKKCKQHHLTVSKALNLLMNLYLDDYIDI